METILTVTNADLNLLTSFEAVSLFRELLWAEAGAIGIPKNCISVSSDINTPDGGIDAEVRNVQIDGGQGIIKQGLTCYQIKIGLFSLRGNAKVKEILFNERSTELKPRVKSCLDKGGTLVVVLFGWDGPDRKDDQLRDKFRTELEAIDQKYCTANIEIFRQNNLIGFLKPFPSLALLVNRRGKALFQTHQSWSQQDDMLTDFQAGEPQEKFLSALQTALERENGTVHIHVSGEPGIGKTRLVLEATSSETLSPFVIYCDAASKFKDSELMNELMRTDNRFSSILVIDECDFNDRAYIWNMLKNSRSGIRLISIYNEHVPAHGTTQYLDAPPLDDAHVQKILQTYGIPQDEASRWLEFCSGSPRVAHVIGSNLKNNPEDLLASPDTVDVWGRYIAGRDDQNSAQVQERTLVLQHLALFKRFGYGRPLIAEAQAIAKIIERADDHITFTRFQSIIQKLRTRKILQGEYTLYITPKALHIKLWSDWWQAYGNAFSFEEFSSNLSDTLLEWFYEMFTYAAQSEVATTVVEELLGINGPFQNDNYLRTQLGAHFFLSLTNANPEAALQCLKRTVGEWGKEELLNFTSGRREVIWALERIAIWRSLFADAARLLLALGEAENETWSNNASGVFVELFSLAPGKVAPTEAPPQERIPILEEALRDRSKERRLLALRACNQTLESRHFSRSVGAEYQGLRHEPNLWMPETYGELFEALADMVIDTVEELAQRPYVDKKRILADVLRILRFDGKQLPQHIRQRWEYLTESLSGDDFSSQMKRYVGMDLPEDSYDEQGNRVDKLSIRILKLVDQVIINPQLLDTELQWLVTTEAQNGYRFGYEMGKRDATFSLLPNLLEAQRHATNNPSVFFLGGYFHAFFEEDQQHWEEQADLLAENEVLRKWLPELTWRAGISDRSALRLLNLAEQGLIDTGSFRLFSAGRVTQTISEDIFIRWLRFLLESSHTYANSIALDMYYTYYVEAESEHILPEQLTLSLLKLLSLFQITQDSKRDPMDDFHWTEIGKKFVQLYPERSAILADWILEHIEEDNTILNLYSNTLSVLNEITLRYPQVVWTFITKYLGPPMDRRAWYIQQWLRGGDVPPIEGGGALSSIPLAIVWQWVDEDVERRARYLASFVPPSLFRQEGHMCIAREVLIRYGNREDVRHAFMANFSTGTWWGPESAHYESVKQQLLEFKEGEKNGNVNRWIDEYIH